MQFFCRSAQQELNVSYEISIFRSMFMWHNYWWKNYTEETELDTNPSLTLARTLTIHWWAYFWPFHVQSLLRHNDF